jgi:hypothetical protein
MSLQRFQPKKTTIHFRQSIAKQKRRRERKHVKIPVLLFFDGTFLLRF